MHSSILLPLAVLAALAVYKVASIISIRMQNRSLARQWDCQDPPTYPFGGFLGLESLKQMKAADKAKLFPDLIVARQKKMSDHFGRTVSTFKGSLFGQTLYFTSDPKNIQAILATKFQDFDLGEMRNIIMGEVLGSGIFTQDGKAWEHSRAMLRPNFVREQISDLEMEERHVRDLIEVMPVQEDGWTKFTDIQTLFFRLTIDAATEFLFGESVHSQIAEADMKTASPGQDERAFSVNFDRAQYHMSQKFRLADMHWLYRSEEYKTNNKIVNDFAKHYVDLALQRLQTPNNNNNKPAPNDSGKPKYVFLDALAQQTQNPDELRSQVLNILLAGRDTTASLLSWTFHQLLRHPQVFATLRSAILDSFGPYSAPTREITFAALKNCQFLQYTLNEVLRLWTIVPSNGRRTNKATFLPRGGGPDGLSPIFLPKNTQVDYSIHVMQRRKDIWGPDAEEFRPERFVGRKPGWEFLPFNGGPRICIGQQFALTEASYVMVRLLQRFDAIEAAPGSLEGAVRSNLTLTSCPGDPVTLRLHEAKE